MRYLNRKYKKQCITCKKFNLNENKEQFDCPLDKILFNLQENNATEEEIKTSLFSNSCENFDSLFYKPTKINEIHFEEFEYNVEKDNMSKFVKLCHPDDENKNTFLGYNIGFIPINPDIEILDKSKLRIFTNFDLAFYVPDLNIIVFSSECIWFPIENQSELNQILQEEKDYFIKNQDNIITTFYPNLFKNTIENSIAS